MAVDRHPVDRAIVLEVCRDFHLHAAADAAGAQASIERSEQEPLITTASAQDLPAENADDGEPADDRSAPRRSRFLGFIRPQSGR
jgi:hypothetical protein